MAKVTPVLPRPGQEPNQLPGHGETRRLIPGRAVATSIGASTLNSVFKVGPVHNVTEQTLDDYSMFKQLLSRKVSWVLITAFTAVLCYTAVRPALCSHDERCQEQHSSATELVPYSSLISASLAAVLMHELASVILTFRTAQKALSLIPNVRESLIPSALLCTSFAVLLLENMPFYAANSAWFVHASVSELPELDRMPVYTIFYVEWLVNVPILLVLAGGVSLGRPGPEVAEPLVLTNIYMILAWCADFISNAPGKWAVVAVSFLMYFKASYDMFLWVKRWRVDNPDGHLFGRPLLAMALVLVFGIYGLVYVFRLVGVVSWKFECIFFLTMNFSTKLCASMSLAGIRSSEFQEVLLVMLANTQTSFQRTILGDIDDQPALRD
ncbi:unnamed protein product [Symbiodinium natans]|uniref:Uncharacterized protein n=1 Tax=Symbiodinium natans TaxID=878477 RepID=A0A812S403_9DINO|nr:unnamed protein product [Symbiodinium natans]